jgi:hypothetical protein
MMQKLAYKLTHMYEGVDETLDGFDRAQRGVSRGGQRDLVRPFPKLYVLRFGDGDEEAVLQTVVERRHVLPCEDHPEVDIGE